MREARVIVQRGSTGTPLSDLAAGKFGLSLTGVEKAIVRARAFGAVLENLNRYEDAQ